MKKFKTENGSITIKNPMRLELDEISDVKFIETSIKDIEKVLEIKGTFIGADKKTYDKVSAKTKEGLLEYKTKFEKIKLNLGSSDEEKSEKKVTKNKKTAGKKIN